jgi:hypothetical protein
MRWKTTLSLLAATVLVGAYVSFYELRQPPPEDRERLANQVVSILPDAVTQLTLDLPTAKVTLSRGAAGWTIAPNGLRANESAVSAILDELSPLMAERVLTPAPNKPLDLKAYGLDPATGWLTVVAQGRPTTLWLGQPTPIGTKRYLKIADGAEVFIVASRLFDAANQPATAFRDPLLAPLRHWSVDELTLASAGGTTALTRADSEWRLTQPFADRADRAEVNAVLDRLGQLSIKRFVDDAPKAEEASAWGFEAPKLSIILKQHQPPLSTTLVFGKPLPDDASLLYAKRSDEPSLYAVAASDVEAILSDPQRLRATACFQFFTSAVNKIRLLRGATDWTIERREERWEEPATKTVLGTDEVETFLNKLADLRVSGFVGGPAPAAGYGLEPPMGVIEVWTGAEQPQRLMVGAPVKDGTDRYGRIDGREIVVKLPAIVQELLDTVPEQLRPGTPPAAASDGSR